VINSNAHCSLCLTMTLPCTQAFSFTRKSPGMLEDQTVIELLLLNHCQYSQTLHVNVVWVSRISEVHILCTVAIPS